MDETIIIETYKGS